MENKAFTLIELLAVIIIISIIALIAVPTIIKTIDNSKKKTLEISAYNLIDALELYYVNSSKGHEFNGPNYDGLNFKGEKVENGYLKVDDSGNTFLWLFKNNNCIIKNGSKIKSLKTDNKEDCMNAYSNKSYNVGDYIYYNPETDEVNCKDYVETNSLNENKIGCMKWYVTKDEINYVNLLLDHNTTYYIQWDITGNTNSNLVNNKLTSDVSNWNNKIKSSARLITADEIWEITKKDNNVSNWSSSSSDNSFHFEGSGHSSDEPNKYAWLFNYTTCQGLFKSGCNIGDGNTMGYWTSSKVYDSNNIWAVSLLGSIWSLLASEGDSIDTKIGIRPVITLSKDNVQFKKS